MPSSTERNTPATPEEEATPAPAEETADTTETEKPEPAAEETAEAENGTESADTTEPKDTTESAEATDTTESTDTEEPKGRAAGRVGAGRRRLALAVSVFGELLITAGAVLALFVVYSLWWTNVLANQEAERDGNAVRENWAAAGDDDGDDRTSPATFEPEDGLGFLHVPTMTGADILVKEGIDLDILNGGVAGYYDEPVQSAMPWDEEGNFSVAAHRDGHGAKFHNIQRIEEGDPIVFETKNTWYIYRAYAILPETSRYNTAVLDPIPEESGKTEAGQYITLTTCTPVYTSEHRYIVWGELERTEHVNAQRDLPQELLEFQDD
ncbi:class E sortase [Streptomyces johnsoniae]|uniref:Class E sortase n=1 Tax=Streptomyces johnsoniae TaxID=3075532 RepID=A0ABU2SAE4_9ACTN|nr:class E sortase [Streptomyces sp. DSM 41886]MDT0445946.1 class E sortase [Streptomyces sp. DSM 41886]